MSFILMYGMVTEQQSTAPESATTKLLKKHQATVDEIHSRWVHHPFMKDCPQRHAKQMAVILDNQHLISQSFDLYSHPIHRVSVEIVSKIFKNHPIFDMVSVQPLIGPTGPVFYLKFRYVSKNPQQSNPNELLGMLDPGITPDPKDLPEINLVIEHEDVTAKTKKTKACWSYEEEQRGNVVDLLSSEIRDEIFREVSTDLRNNAGTIMSKQMSFEGNPKEIYESIYINIVEMSGIIHRKTLRGGCNWLVMGPKLGKIMQASMGFSGIGGELDKITYMGTMNARWKLFVDPLFPDYQILTGYKGDSYMDCGYMYSPYISLTEAPVILDPESFIPRRGYLMRYGKKLLREGAKHFGMIKYNTQPEVKKEDVGSYAI